MTPGRFYKAVKFGKGYGPDYKTKDRDLRFPSSEPPWQQDPEYAEEMTGEVLEEKTTRPKYNPGPMITCYDTWSPEKLTPAPEGWSPRQ